MSSRIHYAKDADAALMYAPLPMRDQAESGRRIDGTRGALGGDHALMQLRRRRTFNSDKAPELPTDAPRSMPRALRLCGVGGAAALVVWAMVTVLETRKAAE